MFCVKCNHDLAECECPDLEERFRSVQNSKFIVIGLDYQRRILAHIEARKKAVQETKPDIGSAPVPLAGYEIIKEGKVGVMDLVWNQVRNVWEPPVGMNVGAAVGYLFAVSRRVPCCERDRDGDGNCDRHPAKKSDYDDELDDWDKHPGR